MLVPFLRGGGTGFCFSLTLSFSDMIFSLSFSITRSIGHPRCAHVPKIILSAHRVEVGDGGASGWGVDERSATTVSKDS